VQNLYYQMLHTVYPEFLKMAQQGKDAATKWVGQFVSLGEQLSIQVA
jgi:hypothetical protein